MLNWLDTKKYTKIKIKLSVDFVEIVIQKLLEKNLDLVGKLFSGTGYLS